MIVIGKNYIIRYSNDIWVWHITQTSIEILKSQFKYKKISFDCYIILLDTRENINSNFNILDNLLYNLFNFLEIIPIFILKPILKSLLYWELQMNSSITILFFENVLLSISSIQLFIAISEFLIKSLLLTTFFSYESFLSTLFSSIIYFCLPHFTKN